MMGVFLKTQEITHPNPFYQVVDIFQKTYRTLRALGDSESNLGIQHMSSVVGIFETLHNTLTYQGFIVALSFILLINVSLAIFNLLPIPVLDGGHIVIGLIEMIIKKPIPIKIIGPIIGIFSILLIALIIYATFQ